MVMLTRKRKFIRFSDIRVTVVGYIGDHLRRRGNPKEDMLPRRHNEIGAWKEAFSCGLPFRWRSCTKNLNNKDMM